MVSNQTVCGNIVVTFLSAKPTDYGCGEMLIAVSTANGATGPSVLCYLLGKVQPTGQLVTPTHTAV